MSWCHTSPHAFQLHLEMLIVLSPKHNISVTGSAKNCTFTGDKYL